MSTAPGLRSIRALMIQLSVMSYEKGSKCRNFNIAIQTTDYVKSNVTWKFQMALEGNQIKETVNED